MTREALSREEVVRLLGVSEEFLRLLEEEHIVDAPGRYGGASLERVRICWSLHQELGVNLPGLEVALTLLDRIQAERRQFREVLSWLDRELHS